MRLVEHRFAVYMAVEVTEQLDEAATARWLEFMAQSAARVQEDGDSRELAGPGGVVRIQREPFPEGTPTYEGLMRD